MSYKVSTTAEDNEQVFKRNMETGEESQVKHRPNNIPSGKIIHRYESFNKVNDKALRFLTSVLTNEELGIVFKMVQRANYETNILLPLNDSMSYREIGKQFNINKDKVDKIFSKLFSLGVYAQVSVANGDYSEYWTLNPYISWKGKFIPATIGAYFNKTIIATACFAD